MPETPLRYFVISCQLKPSMVFVIPLADQESMLVVYENIKVPYKYMATLKDGSDTYDVWGVLDRKLRRWMNTKSPKILLAGNDFKIVAVPTAR